MGVVFKAYDPDLDRPVALKLMHAGEGSSDEVAHDRLLREAQALARLQHPNVIAVYDVGPFRRDVFIAMEFVQGKTLRQWLKEVPRSRREVLDAFLAAGEGLLAAHRAGLVHRDFKPDNAILGNDGRVRVLDFGLARAAGARAAASAAPPPGPRPQLGAVGEETVSNRRAPKASPAEVSSETNPPPSSNTQPDSGSHSSNRLLETPLTHAGAIVGTPRFMAPEQHTGDLADERADQFSFCVALYYALYRSFPFGHDDPDRALDDVLQGKVADPPPGATVPRWLRQVLLRGLRANPADRYPSMVELLAALRADPSVVQRRRLRATAVLVTLAGAGLLWRAAAQREVRVCAGADRKLVGVWDEARRAEVRTAFHHSKKPYAEAALATVERTFDRYARDWLTMHVDACEATQVRKEQSQELLDLRMTCLRDRLTQLSTLSELFSHVDDELVVRAAESAQSLPALAVCADAAALRAPIPPPPDSQTRQRVDHVRQELARGNALELAARTEEALTLTRAALRELEPLRYPPVQAEAQFLYGNLLSDRGDYAHGTTALQEAFVAALAGRDDDTAARTAIQLVHTLGVYQSQHAEGHRWAAIGEALISRLQEKNELGSLLAHKRSMLLQDEGKYDEALSSSTRAVELAKRLWGPEHLRVGQYYQELGNVYYQQGRYPEALDSYGRSLAIERKELGADHPMVAVDIFSIANIYGDRGEHERALVEDEHALAILAAVQVDHPYVPTILISMGADLLALDRVPEAFDKFRLAYAASEKRVGASLDTATALLNLGTCKLRLKALPEAQRYFEEARAMAERVAGPEHALYGQVLSGIGDLHAEQRKLDQALGDYRRAVSVSEQALGKDHPQVAQALLGVGRTELALHAPAAAAAPLERAEAIFTKDGDAAVLASVRFALAQALWSAPPPSQDRPRAIALAKQARDVFAKATSRSAGNDLAEVTAWLAARR
jgi:tetratricopeptide (TPR) repeat protein